jgi:hypothetical protein
LISFQGTSSLLSLSPAPYDCWQRRKIFRQQIRWKSQRFMMIDGVFYHSSSYVRIRVKIDIIMWLFFFAANIFKLFFGVKFMMHRVVLWKNIKSKNFNEVIFQGWGFKVESFRSIEFFVHNKTFPYFVFELWNFLKI